MAYRRNYGGWSRGNSFDGRDCGKSGIEAAKQHIREAAELSRELGGTDCDVKAYFYSLSGPKLAEVWDDYETKYGLDKRQYAENTLAKWKSGRTQMSGLVAGRLFSLLPRHMPVSKKFELVESLWRFCGPSSKKKFYVGPDASAEELAALVAQHLNRIVQSYSIDATISNRFSWLAETDSKLCQDLRNHFLNLEKEQIGRASGNRIELLLNQIRRTEVSHQKLVQVLEIGKHTIEIHFSPESMGISDHPPKLTPIVSSASTQSHESRNSSDNVTAWVWGIIVFIIIVFAIAASV